MLLTGIPSLERPKTVSALYLISSRPASSGGRVPAPGTYGFGIGFIGAFYKGVFYSLQDIDNSPDFDSNSVALAPDWQHRMDTGRVSLAAPLERRACGDFWVQPMVYRPSAGGAVGWSIEVPGVRTME